MSSMKNQDILERAISLAIEGGWDVELVGAASDWGIDENGLYDDRDYYVTERVTPYEIIFNHDFAKALWGENALSEDYSYWQQHLMMMVIAPDPIKYLGENIA